MHIDELHRFCLQLKGTSEDFPFDQKTVVFRVMGKIYTLIDIEEPDSINLKCDPERAVDLRERYEAVQPGYHMNKKHWNTVYFQKDLGEKEVKELIVHSYELVKASLPKKLRDELAAG